MRPSRAIQRLRETAALNGTIKLRTRKGKLIQQCVSEAETILGLNYIVPRLEASRARSRMADRGSTPPR